MDKIAALQEILSHTPEEAFARYGLAMAYAAEGRQREALAEFDRIIRFTPDYVPAYQMSAQELLKAGRPDEARTRLESGLLAADPHPQTAAADDPSRTTTAAPRSGAPRDRPPRTSGKPS